MIGLIQLSGIGIVVAGGVIALIIYNIPQLRFLGANPLLAFVLGMGIAYFLDDFNNSITYADKIVIAIGIVALIIQIIPLLKDWMKSKREDLEKINAKIDSIDKKINNLEGKVETILNLYPRKK
ncbi:MAG: hypothetical protein AABW80_01770 [Nanoarchaeota archaeon]